MELSQLAVRLQEEQSRMKEARGKADQESRGLSVEIRMCAEKDRQKESGAGSGRARFQEYETAAYTVVQKAVEAYEKFL